MKRPAPLNIPIGRIEFLGQVLNIVEHDGRLVAACTDESGMPSEILSSPRLDARACHRLMCDSLSLLFETAELSLVLTAYASARARPASSNDRPQTADRAAICGTPARERVVAVEAVVPTAREGKPPRAFPTDIAVPCALSPVPSAEG